jgi:hypothetical protein
LILAAGLLVVLAGCRGDAELKCDSGGAYLSAVEVPRVKAPEGLDDLDQLKEVPLPDASPREERAEGSGCLESPPDVRDN